jgi:hypothetical protein
MESRSEDVGVLPFELRIVSISLIESSPMFSGAGLCEAAGAWFEET